MDQNEITKLRSETVADITEQLPALTDDELAGLLAAEELDDTPRKTLLAAIRTEQESRVKEPQSGGGKGDAPAAGNAAAPAFLADDYLGPLTADQAQARLKKFGHHTTKPATATGTK